MKVEPLAIPDVLAITPDRHDDARGYFSVTYSTRDFEQVGIETVFVQDNHSFSIVKGTVRGLHFQTPPHSQAKLVRVVRGAIYDVAVDLRRGSPTFGRFAGRTLDAENRVQLYVPVGFAHGFCTLTGEAEVLYKVTSLYSPDHEAGLFWADPELRIPWPMAPAAARVSEKDACAPRLAAIDSPFVYRQRAA